MKLMHTRLPDFYTKIEAAAKKLRPETGFSVSGLENVKTAKLASLRVGRVEDEIVEITEDKDIKKVEVVLTTANPETLYTVVVKGITDDGKCKKVILENMMLSASTVETHLFGVEEVIDRRSNIKR